MAAFKKNVSDHRRRSLDVLRCSSIMTGALILAAIVLMPIPSEASAFGWLRSRKGSGSSTKQAQSSPEPVIVTTAEGRPDFFQTEQREDLSGRGMAPLEFAQTHWDHARTTLEKAVKQVMARINDRNINEICTRLYTIDTQIYRRALRTSAQAITELGESNRSINSAIDELNRLITAPRQETLSNLEAVIERLGSLNRTRIQQTRAFLSGAEALIRLGSEGFQTLELIPSMTIVPLDTLFDTSKKLLQQIRSSNEALKGFLLNVETSSDQINATLTLMTETLKSTLKFSDHFAFRQFPLINLPVPTRERLFSHTGTLRNISKAVANTLTIADSNMRNFSQQVTHLVQTGSEKMIDSLKYYQPIDFSAGSLPQMLLYAANQVSGLFTRLRDGIAEIEAEMARLRTAPINAGSPRIAIEVTPASPHRNAAVAADRLPLFLLGKGGSPDRAQSQDAAPITGARRAGPEVTVAQAQFMPIPKPAASVGNRGKSAAPANAQGTVVLRPDELNLLEREFGDAFSQFADCDSAVFDSSREVDDNFFRLPDDDNTVYDGNGFVSLYSEGNHLPPSAESTSSASAELPSLDTSWQSTDGFSDFIPMFQGY